MTCCLTISFLGSDSPDKGKMCKFYFNQPGGYHKNKSREEDDTDVQRKDNKSEREAKVIRGAF